jgi:hypothetical protein
MQKKTGYGSGYWEPMLTERSVERNQLVGEELRFS